MHLGFASSLQNLANIHNLNPCDLKQFSELKVPQIGQNFRHVLDSASMLAATITYYVSNLGFQRFIPGIIMSRIRLRLFNYLCNAFLTLAIQLFM